METLLPPVVRNAQVAPPCYRVRMSAGGHLDKCEDIASELESVSERLGDISMALVRDALEQGSGRPDDDKVLAQARRSVDKALDLLRRLTTR